MRAAHASDDCYSAQHWRSCHICCKQFSSPANLSKHVASAHDPRGADAGAYAGGMAPYGCAVAAVPNAAAPGAPARGAYARTGLPLADHFAPGSSWPDVMDTGYCAGGGSGYAMVEFGSPAALLAHLRAEGCCPAQAAWLAALRECPDCSRRCTSFEGLSAHAAAAHLPAILEAQREEARWEDRQEGSDGCSGARANEELLASRLAEATLGCASPGSGGGGGHGDAGQQAGGAGGSQQQPIGSQLLPIDPSLSTEGFPEDFGDLAEGLQKARMCPQCERGFRSLQALSAHVESKHDDLLEDYEMNEAWDGYGDSELAQCVRNCGFTDAEAAALACAGVRPWDREANDAMRALRGGFGDY
eukprot:scaffold19.g1877.t1